MEERLRPTRRTLPWRRVGLSLPPATGSPTTHTRRITSCRSARARPPSTRRIERPTSAPVAIGKISPSSVSRGRGLGQTYGFLQSQLCGHSLWRKFLVANPALVNRALCFRFDVDLGPCVSRLDDVAAVPGMTAAAERAFVQAPELRRFARLVVSKMFYLELTGACAHATGSYTFVGHVRSRWKALERHYDQFRDYIFASRGAVVVQGVQVGPCVLDLQGNLGRSVSVKVRDLTMPVSVQLQTEDGGLEHISGSPFQPKPYWETLYYQRVFGTDARPRILTELVTPVDLSRRRKRRVDDE
ncbi:hypothetical protein LTR67_001825 [Exophiala xenobiotica]